MDQILGQTNKTKGAVVVTKIKCIIKGKNDKIAVF